MGSIGMFVQINMQYYNTGKDKTRKKWNDFEVREEFWSQLLDFANEDMLSYVKDDGELIDTHKTEEFINCITSIARTEEELQIVDDLRYCMWGTGVSLRNTYVSSSIVKTIAEINDNYATFYSMKTREPFKVQLSDRVKDKAKVGDEVLINVLMNGKWIIVDVIE